MASDKKESKKSKDPSKKKGDVKAKTETKDKGDFKIEVMNKDSKKDLRKRSSVGATSDELYGSKLPKAKTPDVSPVKKKAPLLCPDCGAELQDGLAKCPECGLELGSGEEIVCAVCGGIIDPSSEVCPLCGTKLTMATDEAKAHEGVVDAKIPIEDISHHHHELRKDKERPVVTVGDEGEVTTVKGPEAAKGKAKGTKGKRPKGAAKRPLARKKGLLQSPSIVPISIVLILIFAVVIVEFLPNVPLAVDGQFGDWDQVTMQSDDVSASAPAGTQVKEYAVQLQGSDVYLYLRANGKMFSGTQNEPAYAVVFVDADRNDTTGYKVGSIGAEKMLCMKGWDGVVKEAKAYSFDQSASQQDWNGLKETGGLKAKASGSELELVSGLNALGLNKASKPSIRFMLRSPSGTTDMSDAPIGLQPGGIAVTQYLKAPKTPVAPGTKGQVFTTIQMDAKGRDDKLETVKFTRLGQGPVGDVSLVTLWSGDVRVDSGKLSDVPGTNLEEITFSPNLLVTASQPVVLTLKMDLWDKASGKALGAMVTSTANITFKSSPSALYTVQQDEAMSYINRTPLEPTVDGTFGDWSTVNSDEHLYAGGGPRPDIDLKAVRSDVVSAGHVKLELEVTGDLLAGLAAPGLWTMNGTCSQGPGCPGTGEAVVMIYIDADNKTTTGKNLGPVGADYAIIVHGKYGRIEQASIGVYDYDTGKDSWEMHTVQGVTAFGDLHRMEIELDLTKTNIQASKDMNLMVELKDGLNYCTRSGMIEG
jgi:hypothetical protein